MFRAAPTILAAVLTLGITGCGTCASVITPCPAGGHYSNHIYSGVRADAELVADSVVGAWKAETVSERASACGSTLLWCLDAPLSAVADTLLLPVTAYAAIDHGLPDRAPCESQTPLTAAPTPAAN
jgi:uncharacterized protein YceK